MGEPLRKKGTNPMGDWYSNEEYQKMIEVDQAAEARDSLRAMGGFAMAIGISMILWSLIGLIIWMIASFF